MNSIIFQFKINFQKEIKQLKLHKIETNNKIFFNYISKYIIISFNLFNKTLPNNKNLNYIMK